MPVHAGTDSTVHGARLGGHLGGPSLFARPARACRLVANVSRDYAAVWVLANPPLGQRSPPACTVELKQRIPSLANPLRGTEEVVPPFACLRRRQPLCGQCYEIRWLDVASTLPLRNPSRLYSVRSSGFADVKAPPSRIPPFLIWLPYTPALKWLLHAPPPRPPPTDGIIRPFTYLYRLLKIHRPKSIQPLQHRPQTSLAHGETHEDDSIHERLHTGTRSGRPIRRVAALPDEKRCRRNESSPAAIRVSYRQSSF